MSLPEQNVPAVTSGLLQNIIRLTGSDSDVRQAQATLSKLTPETAAVYQVLNALPPGELKDWLMANPIQFWKKVIALFKGRKWTTGDYTLGERLYDQVYHAGDIGQKQVTDDMVSVAHTLFNQLFGVRIATDTDLDTLDAGVYAYKARPVSEGISQDAIERAVFLKQHFFPISTYNKQPWDLRYFELYPLVDRIPDHEIGKWYTGEVLGGGYAVDGIIPVTAQSILKQYPGADFDPTTGNVTTTTGEVIIPGESTGDTVQSVVNYLKENPIVIGIAAVAGYYLYENALL